MSPHQIVTGLQYGRGTGWLPFTQRAENRNPSRDAREAPDDAVRFRYYSVAKVELGINMVDVPTVKVESEPFHHSDMYYIDAELVSISVVEEAVNEMREDKRKCVDIDKDLNCHLETLLSNARQCNLDTVIKARDGSMFTPHHRYALISSFDE